MARGERDGVTERNPKQGNALFCSKTNECRKLCYADIKSHKKRRPNRKPLSATTLVQNQTRTQQAPT